MIQQQCEENHIPVGLLILWFILFNSLLNFLLSLQNSPHQIYAACNERLNGEFYAT